MSICDSMATDKNGKDRGKDPDGKTAAHANTLWAYATMGREPGAGVMREPEGRAEAVAGTFNAQEVTNTLCGGLCIFPSFRPWSRMSMGAYSGAATGVPG